MIYLKIFLASTGMTAVFFGFYLAFASQRKKEIIGLLTAIAGFLLFLFSVLLIFVPRFFR